MQVLILNGSDVKQLLSMKECIDVVREAFRSLGEGKALLPLRGALKLPPDNKNYFGTMPCYLNTDQGPFFGLKAISVFPGNWGTDFHSHAGVVLLFGAEHGQVLSVLEAGEITATRTAAASAVASDYLANPSNPQSYKLCILGAGVQAKSHIEAMTAIRNFTKIVVWSRNRPSAQKLVDEMPNYKIEIIENVQDAVHDSDIICTVTASKEPLFSHEHVKPGCHINAVGASTPIARELSTETIAKALVFTDRRESLLNEAGDFVIPLKEGKIDESHLVGELADLVLNKVQGRKSETDVTVFKSLGVAIEDIACAAFLYKKASLEKKGKWVDFGEHAK